MFLDRRPAMIFCKKLIKTICTCMSLFALIACCKINANAAELVVEPVTIVNKTQEIDEKIPSDATKYAVEKVSEVVEAVKLYYESFENQDMEYSLGIPFVIYSSTNNAWNSVYYYPLIQDNSIALIISIIDTNYGWTLSASQEMVEELNEINYAMDSSWIFYEENNDIIALSEKEKKVITEDIYGNSNSTFNASDEKIESYAELVTIISEQIEAHTPFDTDYIKEISADKDIVESYTPSFSANTSVSKVCSLYNAQGQIGGTCWAASVATIVNYRLGTNYTAYDVCDKIGADYAGGTIDDKQDALMEYGFNYSKTTSQTSWSSVQRNVAGKHPIAASTFSANNQGHAVTVYGYRTLNETDYVFLWNSGTESAQIAEYRSSGTTYTYNSVVWTWTKSLQYLA